MIAKEKGHGKIIAILESNETNVNVQSANSKPSKITE